MQISRVICFIFLLSMLLGCNSDQPAKVERKEGLYYGKSGVVKLITIKSERSLKSLADDYDISVEVLAKANNLPTSANLVSGEVIRIPVSAAQFEEELYDNSEHHRESVEEISLPDDDSHSKQLTDAYNEKSATAVKGGGYLGSIKVAADSEGDLIFDGEDKHVAESISASSGAKLDAVNTDTALQNSDKVGLVSPATNDPVAPIETNTKPNTNSDKVELVSPATNDPVAPIETNTKPNTSSDFKFATPLNLAEFIWPLKGRVISRYGKSGNGFNEGINISAPAGTSVKAVADGSVIYTGKEPKVYGNLIIIKHHDGFLSAYAHNDVMLIKKGAKVSQGDVIAKVGSTGAVSSPQLHFSIRQDKKTVNPEQNYREKGL